MTCSQVLDRGQGDQRVWYDTITVTDIPKGHFLTETSNTIAVGGATRQIIITLMKGSWADGGTHSICAGGYLRSENEKAVHVKVVTDGIIQCENTQVYP